MFYTFLFSHKNTTCIRQAQGDTLEEATEAWLPLLKDVPFGQNDDKSVLDIDVVRQELKESRLVPLSKLHNVWCSFLRFRASSALLNVVLTQDDSRDDYVLA